MSLVCAVVITIKGLLGLFWYAFQESGSSRRLTLRIAAEIAVLSIIGFTAAMILSSLAWVTIGSALLVLVTGQIVHSPVPKSLLKRMDEGRVPIIQLMIPDGSSPLCVSDTQHGEEHHIRSANCSHSMDVVGQ